MRDFFRKRRDTVSLGIRRIRIFTDTVLPIGKDTETVKDYGALPKLFVSRKDLKDTKAPFTEKGLPDTGYGENPVNDSG